MKRAMALVLAAASSAAGLAQTAGMMSFQAVLKDGGGVPVIGAVTLEIEIFDAASGGAKLDANGDGVVNSGDTFIVATTAVEGVISIKYGPVAPSVFGATSRWLNVNVTSPVLPAIARVEIVTPPAIAEQLNARGTGTAAVVTTPAGNVGVGVSAPDQRFVVNGSIAAEGTGRLFLSRATAGSDINATSLGFTSLVGGVLTLSNNGDNDIRAGFLPGGALRFIVNNTADPFTPVVSPTNGIEAMRISSVGNVGIGTSTPQTKLDVSGAISGFGIVPIGSIIAWHKNLPGVPALPDGWVECNGQTISDPASPLDGQAIPDLNTPLSVDSGGRFLRGGQASGVMQDATAIYEGWRNSTELINPSLAVVYFDGVAPEVFNMQRNHAQATGGVETIDVQGMRRVRPVNMSVVWVMRVK